MTPMLSPTPTLVESPGILPEERDLQLEKSRRSTPQFPSIFGALTPLKCCHCKSDPSPKLAPSPTPVSLMVRAISNLKVLAIVALLVNIVLLWPTLSASFDGRHGLDLTRWGALKEYREYCLSEPEDTSEECKNARTELLPPPPALHKSSLAAKGEKGSAKSNTTIERRSTADDPDTSNSSYLSKYDSYQNTLIKKIRTTTSASVQTSICTATSQASVPYGVRFQGEASLIYPYRAGSTEDGIHAAGDDSYCACDTDEGIRPTTPVVSSLNSETSSTGSVITSDIGSLVSSLASQAPTLIPNVPSIVSSIAFSAASVVESEVSSILVPASSTTPVPSAEISSILSSIQSSLQSELSTILPTSSGILPPPSALCSRPFVPISAAADDDGNCDVLGDKPSMVLGPVSETDGFERATQPSAKESVSIEYGIPEGRHEHTTEPLGFVNDISQTRFGVEKTELRTTPNLTALIKALLNRSEAATTCERKKLL